MKHNVGTNGCQDMSPYQRQGPLDKGFKSGANPTTRVARFFLIHDTKTGKNGPKEYKWYEMVIKYPKSP
jgi:hypothetical protein